MEEWRPVFGYEGLYEVSSIGRVRAFVRIFKSRDNFMKHHLCGVDGNRYYSIKLSKDGHRKAFKIHKLVATAFMGYSELFVNHKDQDKLNNNIENLEYVSRRENRNHSWRGKYLKGAWFDEKHNYWTSSISIKGKKNNIGYFKTEIEAHTAYLTKCKELGEMKYV